MKTEIQETLWKKGHTFGRSREKRNLYKIVSPSNVRNYIYKVPTT